MAKNKTYKNESKITVTSNRFPNVTVELYSKLNEQNTPIYIVRHNDLVAAIDSPEVRATGCRYEYGQIQIIGDMHYLVECIIRDGNGNFEIREHGEVMPETLLTDISRQYPAKMCTNRAFDRAAIRYLGLGKRVYSENEIDPSGLRDNLVVESTQTVNEAKTEDAPASKTEKKEIGFANVNSEKELKEETPKKNEKAEEKEQAKQELKTEENKKKAKDCYEKIGKMKLGFMTGYKDMTIKEIAEKEPKKLVWVAEHIFSGVHFQTAEYVRFYLKCRNIEFKAA